MQKSAEHKASYRLHQLRRLKTGRSPRFSVHCALLLPARFGSTLAAPTRTSCALAKKDL
jgi:hypothetical protein